MASRIRFPLFPCIHSPLCTSSLVMSVGLGRTEGALCSHLLRGVLLLIIARQNIVMYLLLLSWVPLSVEFHKDACGEDSPFLCCKMSRSPSRLDGLAQLCGSEERGQVDCVRAMSLLLGCDLHSSTLFLPLGPPLAP